MLAVKNMLQNISAPHLVRFLLCTCILQNRQPIQIANMAVVKIYQYNRRQAPCHDERCLPCMLAVTIVHGCQIDSGSEGLCCCCGSASHVHNSCVSGLSGTLTPQCMRVWHIGGVTRRDRDDGPIKLRMPYNGLL